MFVLRATDYGALVWILFSHEVPLCSALTPSRHSNPGFGAFLLAVHRGSSHAYAIDCYDGPSALMPALTRGAARRCALGALLRIPQHRPTRMPAPKIIIALKMAPLRVSQMNVVGSLIACPQLRWVIFSIAQVVRSGKRDSSLVFFGEPVIGGAAPPVVRAPSPVPADTEEASHRQPRAHVRASRIGGSRSHSRPISQVQRGPAAVHLMRRDGIAKLTSWQTCGGIGQR
jgi:hypothetical protein